MLRGHRAVNARVEHVANLAEVTEKLQGPPAILLSASVPYKRTPPKDATATQRKRLAALNRPYLESSQPARIRAAVIALTRSILMRGMRLVFGAHPAISPMVLSAGRDVQPESHGAEAKPESAGTEPRILIFQSQYFERELPDSTLDLASWDAGLLVFTPVVRVRGKPREYWRSPSLNLMRELMVSVPGLCAAIFVGGMEGVAQEAALFRERHPEKPMYPIASTGSAAQDLWQLDPIRYSSVFDHSSVQQDNPSYSVVAAQILADLHLEGPSDGQR